MFNFRLKSFGNGTAQLSYYHNPILTKDDTYKLVQATKLDRMNDRDMFEYNTPDIDDDEIILRDERYVLYLDNFCMVSDYLYPMERMYESPFGDYIPESHIPKIKKQNAKNEELTPEEIEENRLRCIMSSVNRTKKKIVDYGRGNKWEWFITLTFKQVDEFDKENFEDCKAKVTDWFRNVRRRYCKNIKYLVVPEMHESKCWHFHCLVSNCDELDFEVAVNQRRYLKNKKGEYELDKYGARIPNKYFGQELRTRYPDGELIYNIKQYKNGWTTATKIADTKKAVSYVLKYITQDLCDIAFGKRRYLPSNNLELPVTTFGFMDYRDVNQLITEIEYNTGLKLSIENIKTYSVEVPNYSNMVTVFEFDYPDIPGDDFEGREVRLNEIMEDMYG